MLKSTHTLITILPVLLAASACSAHAQHKSTEKQHSQTGTSGFRVDLPEGWDAESAKDGHVLLHSADRTVFAVAQPFQAPDGGASADWIGPLVRHMSDLFPSATVSKQTQVSESPDEAVARVAYTVHGKPGVATVMCAIADGKGMFYGIAAPADCFAAARPALIKSLNSLRYGPANAPTSSDAHGAAPSSVSYARWKEPNLGMFVSEAPRAWKITGGAYQFAPVDVRTQIHGVSPDGSIRIQFGDASLSAFAPPGPSSYTRGLHEGQSYAANGVSYTVLRLCTAAQFSRIYVQQNLAKKYPDLHLGETQDLPADAEKYNREHAGAGGQRPITIGQTEFTYTQNGRSLNGVCFTRVQAIGQGIGAIWIAYPCVITAPSASLRLGMSVLKHMLDATRIDPAWQAQSARTAAEFDQLVMRNHEAAMAQIRHQYSVAVQRLDENQRQWKNIINGEVDLVDPSTGQTFKGSAGSNSYWNGVGGIVGSQGSSAPGFNLNPLKQF